MRHLKTVTMMMFLSVAYSFLIAPVVSADINMTINDTLGGYTSGQFLQGTVIIESDQKIADEAFVVAYIDDGFVDSVQAGDVFTAAQGVYQPEPFSYEITASGTNSWTAFPAVEFEYVISATGTFDGEPWSWTSGTQRGSVQNQKRGNDFNGEIHGSISKGSDFVGTAGVDNVVWTVTDNQPETVDTTMRMACYKDDSPETFPLPIHSDGWVRVEVEGFRLTFQPGQSYCDYNLGPFDERSFITDRKLFINPDDLDEGGECIDETSSQPVCGGVYKKDRSNENVFRPITDNVQFFPETNTVRIFDCVRSSDTVYFFTFLPPNGEFLCAYTDFSQPGSAPWTDTESVSSDDVGEVSFDSPVVVDHSGLSAPPCPAGTEQCVSTTPTYDVRKTSGSDDVGLSFDGTALAVTVSTASQMIRTGFTEKIGFGHFLNLKSPAQVGNHVLRFDIVLDGETLASESETIVTCEDDDGDGFCGVADCNDNNSTIHLSAVELCNGVDDNCDGTTDEGYLLNQTCNNWPDSVCAGRTVCASDGRAVVCKGTSHNPGDLEEICADGFDNDCDQLTDESGEILGETCITLCVDGTTRPGGNDRGICESLSTCVNGEWSAPVQVTGPGTETCNNLDDNCDGIIDNIGVSAGVTSTPQETACGCTGGGLLRVEACNAIDDNCNGLIDEGISCNTSIPQDTCDNGVLDAGEEGVDCGGRCITACLPVDEMPTEESDGFLLIAGGVIVLIGVLGFVFWKKRQGSSLSEY